MHPKSCAGGHDNVAQTFDARLIFSVTVTNQPLMHGPSPARIPRLCAAVSISAEFIRATSCTQSKPEQKNV